MAPELHARVRTLFDQALDKPEAERPAFLQAACNGEGEVLQAVNRLLEAHRGSETFLEDETRPSQRIGRYLVTGELGRGAMGIVYEAIDPLIGRKVAVKVIHLQAFADAGEARFLRDRLFREARSAGALSHPGIVVVFDVGQEGDLAFIAMERVEGVSLYQVLASGGKIPRAEAFEILRQAASALDYAHRNGVVHRDIKPANIMLDKGVTVKVADFGIAKITSTEHHTVTGMVMGTPSYMSPEQIEALPADGRSDQFSLAVVAYELLAGRRPFQSDSLATLAHMIVFADRPSARTLNPSLPADVDMVFRRSLARLPTDRYPTCTDFVWALEEASKAAVVPEPVIKAPVPDPVPAPAPAVIKVSKPRASNSTGYLLVGVVLLAVIAGILLYKVWPHGGHAPASGDIQGKTEVAPVTAVTPAAQAAPVVTQFVADPPSIESGSAAVLRWNVTGATEVALDPGIGKVPVADKLEVRPRQATTYVLTATGPGGKVTEPVSVNVTPPAAGKPDKPNREQMYADALALLKTNQIAKAMELFRKAAALGEPRAMMELGEIQMEDNPSEAAKWFRKAADAGDSAGMLNLGAMYYLGNVENRAGVSSEDYAIAAYWYGKAAAAGNVDAMYNLGRMNENGQGMPKNLAKAKDLYEKAAGLGNAEAKAGLARLNGNRK
ncbi:MAG: serine/threonine-protein kinase [Bryobacteraceae bacterium]|jgi:serine/threonine-protein kinase